MLWLEFRRCVWRGSSVRRWICTFSDRSYIEVRTVPTSRHFSAARGLHSSRCWSLSVVCTSSFLLSVSCQASYECSPGLRAIPGLRLWCCLCRPFWECGQFVLVFFFRSSNLPISLSGCSGRLKSSRCSPAFLLGEGLSCSTICSGNICRSRTGGILSRSSASSWRQHRREGRSLCELPLLWLLTFARRLFHSCGLILAHSPPARFFRFFMSALNPIQQPSIRVSWFWSVPT